MQRRSRSTLIRLSERHSGSDVNSSAHSARLRKIARRVARTLAPASTLTAMLGAGARCPSDRQDRGSYRLRWAGRHRKQRYRHYVDFSVPDVDQNDGLIVGMIWHGGSGAITSVQCSNESNLSPLGAASGPVTAISDASLQLFSLDQVTQAGTNTKTITANFEAEHGGSPTGFALAVAGGNNAGWFDTGTLQFATGNSNTPTVNVAPSVANTLLVALCVNRAGAATQGAGFTLMNPDDNHWNDDAQYQLDGGAAGSRAVTMSLGAADEWAMLVAALKPAGAGAATNPGQSWQQRGAMGVRVMM
jgi:hypothetical protein